MENNTVTTSEYAVFQFLVSEIAKTPNAPKRLECTSTEDKFRSQHNISNSEEFQTFFRNAWIRFYRLKTKIGKKGSDFILKEGRKDNIEFESIPDVINSPEPSGGKKKRKSFSAAGAKTRRERTDRLVAELDKFLDEESDLNINQLLGYLMYRMNYMKDRKMANLGSDLFHGRYEDNRFDAQDAIAIMHSLTLSKDQMRLMKKIMISKGVHFPSTTELLPERKKLRPPISMVLDGKGVGVDYKDLVKSTVIAQALVLKENGVDIRMVNNVIMRFKDGCDGAGQQVVWKAKSMENATENMFQYGLVPLDVMSGSKILWKNPVPNSPNCLRPVYLIREKESDIEMMQHVIRSTDKAREELMSSGVQVDVDGVNIHIGIDIKDTMKDLKLKKTISGLGGADCIICESKQEHWTDVNYINAGFLINRTMEDTLKLYNDLVNDDGEIDCRSGDFDSRKGLTKEPITSSNQHSITITHSYINITTWFLKLLYRINAEYFQWVEKKTIYGEHIRCGKDRVFAMIKEDTGLVLDVVCKGGAKGGTSTDGKQGRRFFSQELVPTLKKATKEKYHVDLLRIHALLSAVLRVVSSQQLVNIEIYQKYCKELSLLIASYEWVRVNHTLHGVLHHSGDLIVLNGGYALGALSEEGLEATNKFIRRYLELLSRKTSPIDQLNDVMSRLLERSNPQITSKMMALKNVRKDYGCLHCDSNEHSTRHHTIIGPVKYYDVLVNEMLLISS